MLSSLNIKNFALIDNIDIEFSPGLNVITGETGAGKSIIVNALDLALGGRGSEENIRTGSDTSSVTAHFELKKNSLVDSGINEKNITIRRDYKRRGGGKAFLNDKQVSIAEIKNISNVLASILSQHSHQTLLDSNTHITFLDNYAGLVKKLEKLKNQYSYTIDLNNKLEYSIRNTKEINAQIELYRFQVDEIEKADLHDNEEDGLNQEKKILENGLRLRELGEIAVSTLLESDGSTVDKIGEVGKSFEEFKTDIKDIEETLGYLSVASDSIQEAVVKIRTLIDNLDDDPNRLEDINARLQELFRLKKKYGGDVNYISEYLKSTQKELSKLEAMSGDTESFSKELDKSLNSLNKLALSISNERKKYIPRMEKAVLVILREMGMPKAEFVIKTSVHFNENGFYIANGRKLAGDHTGFDKVEFEFCANPGEELKPLAKIASGGEISRVMLAIKNAFVDDNSDGCEIFDEIDVGISGEIAAKVGKQLKKLTQRRQVICITHLHQIASVADSHYKVFKEKVGNRTVSRVKRLSEDERIMEIASLLSGEKISDSAINGARELLKDGIND